MPRGPDRGNDASQPRRWRKAVAHVLLCAVEVLEPVTGGGVAELVDPPGDSGKEISPDPARQHPHRDGEFLLPGTLARLPRRHREARGDRFARLRAV
ncbi:hypothetical protein [Streptomyces sp. NBC_01092]|uniref:hypothetical protein n=1 Tax=Streptomyces sp. NBC_01092 TaxID=2903748 RepID=UPI003870127D|nr:hypothetical protein OG254_00925 [Streptomyces sp. NBC_01092]